MLKIILPRIALRDLPLIFGSAVSGAVIAGAYGALHNQITYTICTEYYTKLKFIQFGYADMELPDTVLAAMVGFRATWWVGLIAAWFLARRLVPDQSRRLAIGQLAVGFGIVFLCGLLALLLGFGYGLWRGPNAGYMSWERLFDQLQIEDQWSFVRVAYIHNASYAGGFCGLILALFLVRPNKDFIDDTVCE